jgi:hypothetical protein
MIPSPIAARRCHPFPAKLRNSTINHDYGAHFETCDNSYFAFEHVAHPSQSKLYSFFNL